jgi:hypothetical protein
MPIHPAMGRRFPENAQAQAVVYLLQETAGLEKALTGRASLQ